MEVLNQLLVDLPMYLMLLCQFLGALSIAATVVVKLTPSPKDDEKVGKYVGMIWKFVSYMPTLGVNPKTEHLEKALKSLKQ